MLLICQGCGARYQVDGATWPMAPDAEGVLSPRPRKVRCRACGETWHALPEEDVLELGDPLPPEEPVAVSAPPPLETAPDPMPRAISPSASGLRTTVVERPVPEPVAEEVEEEKRRSCLVPLLGLLVVAALVLLGLLWTGVVRPERYGLPPFDVPPVELPAWADPARLNLHLPNVRVPSTPPPPLKMEIAAERKATGAGRTLWDVRGTLVNPTQVRHRVPAVELLLVDAAGNVVARWNVRPGADRLGPGEATQFETSAIDPPASAARVRARLKAEGLGRM